MGHRVARSLVFSSSGLRPSRPQSNGAGPKVALASVKVGAVKNILVGPAVPPEAILAAAIAAFAASTAPINAADDAAKNDWQLAII